MLYALIAIAGITGFMAIRTSFPLFKFGAAVPWIAIMAYLVGNYSGENWIVIAMLGCIVMMCAFPLMQLGRDIKRSGNNIGNFSVESSGFQFQTPNWFKKIRGETYKERTITKQQNLADYEEQVYNAMHPNRRRR